MTLYPGSGRLTSSTAIVPLTRLRPMQAITTDDHLRVRAVVLTAEPTYRVAAILLTLGLPKSREEQLIEKLQEGMIKAESETA